MNINPLQIEPGTVFICGPQKVKNQSGAINPDFFKMESRLIELGYKVFNPFAQDEPLSIKVQTACMAMCDVVVTLHDWGLDQNCVNAVNIARILLKEIHPADRYFYQDFFHSER